MQILLILVFPFLKRQARKGELAIEDMDGGTFTISNGGVFGSLMGTPIINPPQSAILGLHAINDRPVAVNGQVRNALLCPIITPGEPEKCLKFESLLLANHLSDFCNLITSV